MSYDNAEVSDMEDMNERQRNGQNESLGEKGGSSQRTDFDEQDNKGNTVLSIR